MSESERHIIHIKPLKNIQTKDNEKPSIKQIKEIIVKDAADGIRTRDLQISQTMAPRTLP